MESRPADSARRAKPAVRRGLENLFLPGVLAIMVGAAWYAARAPEETGPVSLPDFSLPGLELDLAIELPYQFVPLKRRPAPRLDLGRNTEGVIAAVRRDLLETSAHEAPEVDEVPAVVPEARVAAR